jgi:hypothetical protein
LNDFWIVFEHDSLRIASFILFLELVSASSLLAESPGPGFEAVSLQNFCGGKTLLRLFPSPDPTRVGASGTGSAPFNATASLHHPLL